MKVSSASTIPRSVRGLLAAARAETDAASGRRRRMNAAQLRGPGQARAFAHRARVRGPFLLLAQMRHRRLGQPVEGAPATLAAEPQQPVRATPANDLAAGPVRPQPTVSRPAPRPTPEPPPAQDSTFQARPPDAPASPALALKSPPPRRRRPRPLSQASQRLRRGAPHSFPKSTPAKPQNPQPSSNRSLDPTQFNQINS